MDAAIIAIGSEMLTPQRIDTNSLFLTDQLNARGVEVVCKLIAGDHKQRLVEAMRYALAGCDLLFLSGGLGPTEDDLTRDAVCELTGRPMHFSDAVCTTLEERFRRMNRRMAEVNKRQAFVIDGAEVLENPRGTAPGLWLAHDGKHIVLLPGPPNEFKGVFREQCISRLDALLPAQVIRTRFYRVAGMGESDLDQLIAPLYRDYTNPATTILAAPSDIQVHLRARCDTEAEAEKLLAEVGDPIAAALGDRIYSDNGDPLEAAVGKLLRQNGLTVTVAESCTGGMLAERITSVAGSSDYFAGGFLTYTYEAKAGLLGIDRAFLDEHKAVSEPVAIEMAKAARVRIGSSIGVSITGVAGPGDGGEKEPVGTVFIGIADANRAVAKRYQWAGDRNRIRTLAVQVALDQLRRWIM